MRSGSILALKRQPLLLGLTPTTPLQSDADAKASGKGDYEAPRVTRRLQVSGMSSGSLTNQVIARCRKCAARDSCTVRSSASVASNDRDKPHRRTTQSVHEGITFLLRAVLREQADFILRLPPAMAGLCVSCSLLVETWLVRRCACTLEALGASHQSSIVLTRLPRGLWLCDHASGRDQSPWRPMPPVLGDGLPRGQCCCCSGCTLLGWGLSTVSLAFPCGWLLDVGGLGLGFPRTSLASFLST